MGLSNPFKVFEENGKVGIKDDAGKILIPASFDALGWSDGSFSVIGDVTGYRMNRSWGILNLKKEFITPAEFETLVYAGGDNIIVRKKISPVLTKVACLNLKGEVKIPYLYDGIKVNGMCAVVFNLTRTQYQFGLVDMNNRTLIPVVHRNIYPLGSLRYAVENQDSKIALYSESGKAITGFSIDSISAYYKNKAIIYENLNQGLIDRNGIIQLKPIYRSIKISPEGTIYAEPHHEWLFLNERNEVQATLIADELLPLPENIFMIRYAGKYGLLDESLNTILSPQYDFLQPAGENKFIVYKKGKAGVVHKSNEVLIPLQYDSIFADQHAFRCYRKLEGWSLVGFDNKIITPKHYDWIGKESHGLYPARNNYFWGALNQEGIETVHCVFDSIAMAPNNLLIVKYKKQFGIITATEHWLVPPQNYPLEVVPDFCYVQHQPGNRFLKNFDGEILYFTDNIMDFKKDFWIEHLPDGTEKIINYRGQILSRIAPPVLDKLEKVFPVSEGMRGIKRDNKYGFVDDRNRLRIANRYDGIGEFHEGMAAFKLLGKWGFINKQDQVIINPNYEAVGNFNNGVTIVRKNGKAGLINSTGHTLLSLQYDSIVRQENFEYRLYNNGLMGIADPAGSILLEPRFEMIDELPNGSVIVVQRKKYGLVSPQGLSRIPVIYDSLIFDTARNQYLALKKSTVKGISTE